MKNRRTSAFPVHGFAWLRGTALGLILLGACGGAAWGAYITDNIPVTLRRGPGTEYRILKNLPAAARIEILEEGDPYLKIRVQDGTEGYVLKQYVISEEPQAVIARRLQREQEALRAKVAELTERSGTLDTQHKEASAALQQTETELKKVKSQYEALQKGAQNVTQTMAERDRLAAANKDYAQKIASLEKENHELWRNNILRWFFAGAGVLYFGWLLGRRPSRRTRSF